jgi:hypothetical protein
MSARLGDYEGAPTTQGLVTYEPGWYLVTIPREPVDALVKSLEARGEVIKPSAKPHVSVMKDEVASRNATDWGTRFVGESVEVKLHPTIRSDNGLHFWVDCYCARLCEMREHFGLPTLKRQDGVFLVNFHVTIARRKKAQDPTPRPQLRLSPQSHIDVETGMQHL